MKFKAVPLKQSEKSTYLCTVTFKEVAEIFGLADSTTDVEKRHQRPCSERRAGEVADYILNNYAAGHSYVLPPIVASLGDKFTYKDGFILFDQKTEILINDGQHRHRGIQIAINENPQLEDQEIGVWLIPDVGLIQAQQIFSDINKNAKTPPRSLNLIFDHRSTDVLLTKRVKNSVKLFSQFTESEKGQATKGKLFVFAALHKAVCYMNDALVDRGILADKQTPMIVSFWNNLCNSIPQWEAIANYLEEADGSEIALQKLYTDLEITKKETIAFHNGLIGCLGRIGAEMIQKMPDNEQYFDYFEKRLSPLSSFDFSKNNYQFTQKGIVVVGAKDRLRAVNSTSSRQELLLLLRQHLKLAPKQLEFA
jgi:DNA sulfur modification protein DndB